MTINHTSKVWDGVFDTFGEVTVEDHAFEGDIWLDKVVARASALIEAASRPAAISLAAVTTDYGLPFVAALVARRGTPLRVLDFGGGMATSYVALKAMLPEDQPLDYVVVENERICSVGRDLFHDDRQVRFVSELPAGETFDIVHAGSSIHYVDDWRGLLERFASARPEVILFVDLPAGDIRTFVTAQLFHGKRIPVRFWNLGEFVSGVAGHGYELVFKAGYRGYYQPADAELPLEHFDSDHRLSRFSQLVFRRNDR